MVPTQEISIRLALPDTAAAGSRIDGILEITSSRNEPVVMASPNSNAALNIVVFDRLWNEVPANSLGKIHVAYQQFELAPEQTVSFELSDLAFTTGTARMRYNLQPGIYFVLAIYHPGTARLPDQSSYPIAVASNVVRLAVV